MDIKFIVPAIYTSVPTDSRPTSTVQRDEGARMADSASDHAFRPGLTYRTARAVRGQPPTDDCGSRILCA